MRIIRAIGVVIRSVTIGIMILVACLLGLLWIDHTRATELPTPTGPFAVGRTTALWSDPGHEDPLAPEPGTKRQLVAWIWYPVAPRRSGQGYCDYLPALWRQALVHQQGALIAGVVTRELSRVHGHSIRDAEISPQEHRYPVILMRAGLAKLTTDYTTLAEDLASHGYVVVGFDAPYRSVVVVLPDGRVISRAPQNNADLVSGSQQEQLANKLVQAWSADMRFALDQLEWLNASDPTGRFRGRLDMQAVGVFGHSLGGATALEVCRADSRCKAGIDVDGAPLGSVIREGVKQPFLFLLSDHAGDPEAEQRQVMANIHAIYSRLPEHRRLQIMIRGANHFMFSDDGAILRAPLLMHALHALGVVRLSGPRQVALTAHYVHTFFDVYLKGAPASQLASHPEYPEVESAN